MGRAGGLLDESQTFTRMVSSDPPCRWGAERRATARGRARATAHGDDDDRHERGAHPRCGAKNSRQSVRGDERAGAGARGAVIARDDARWRRDFEIRARARDARSNARCGAVDDARARRVTRDIFVRLFAQVLDLKSADDAYRCANATRAMETVKSRLKQPTDV